MQKSRYQLFAAALLGLLLASCAPKQEATQTASTTETAAPAESAGAAPAGPIARGSAASIQAVLSVEAIDHEKRHITLKGPQGNVAEFEVGPQATRFDEIKVGDKLHVKYDIAVVGELREPTAEEKSTPLVDVTSDPQRLASTSPAAAIGRVVRAVTTIDAVDKSAQTFTVKDPVEGSVAVHVEDPTVLEHLSVGQTIIVTFAESLALAVEPGAK